MHTLRLTPSALARGGYTVRVELFLDDVVLELDEIGVAPPLMPEELEDLRWYLEDFPTFPIEPAVRVAELIERRSRDAGIELFRSLFDGTPGARRIWHTVGHALGQTRIEVALNSPSVDSFPWELLRESRESPPLAVVAKAFVRRSARLAEGLGQGSVETSGSNANQLPQPGRGVIEPKSVQKADAIRALVVICRPDAGSDVPFRSVSGQLLSESSFAEKFAFQVLRPPSFNNLREVLAEASAAGQPYKIVHFDGHGIYEDPLADSDPTSARRKRGYLVFEDPSASNNRELVHGAKLGRELSSNGVQLLVMNACRSAHAGAVALPELAQTATSTSVRAYGSLADESVRAGLPAVIAMRYNVWVDSAARFMKEMYAALANSGSPSEAVQCARNTLFFDAFRAHARRRIEDWQVPVFYEQVSTHILPQAVVSERNLPRPDRSELLTAVPSAPQLGFSGHDAVILAIERIFDSDRVVTLIGPAGSGKTALIGEFARWFVVSGSSAPVLHTSFRDCRNVADVVDSAISAIGRGASGWSDLGLMAKRHRLVRYLHEVPSLWLLDDVHLTTGFVTGCGSEWAPEMQRNLFELLREARETPAKLLFSSRADIRELHGLNSAFVFMPPLLLADRYEILRRVAIYHDKPVTDLVAWEPLLELSQGNKLALVALAECALGAGVESLDSIHSLLNQIWDGAVGLHGTLSECGVRAIDLQLSTALASFSLADQRKLVLLALFRNLFSEGTVRYLGCSDYPWGLSEMEDISAIDLVSLLSRFTETGLLRAFPGGYFEPHPVLPILLRTRLNKLYAANPQRPLRAFVDVIGIMCTYMVRQYNRGEVEWSEALSHERPSLFYALHIALENQWWDVIVSLMQGVRLATSERMRPEWPMLVDRIAPLFVLPCSEGPVPGREEDWSLVMDYRIEVASARAAFSEAERLELARIHWLRLLSDKAKKAGDVDKADYRGQWLAKSLRHYAGLLDQKKDAACLAMYEEAFHLMTTLQMQLDAGLCARDLAIAYGSDHSYADPEKCERWIKQTIELIPDDAKAMALVQMLRARQTSLRALEKFETGEPATPSSQGEFETGEQDQADSDSLIQKLMDMERMMANEMPLPPRLKPRSRLQALWTRGSVRLDKRDERGLTDFLEALQIAGEQNDVVLSAKIGLDLSRKLLNSGRSEAAAQYARTSFEQFVRSGDLGAEGAVEANRLLARIEKNNG